MKFVKGISLFVAYPLLLLGLGFCAGMEVSRLAGQDSQAEKGMQLPMGLPIGASGAQETSPVSEEPESELSDANLIDPNRSDAEEGGTVRSIAGEQTGQGDAEDDILEAASSGDTLCVDTSYVLRETDILHHTSVETTQKLPMKYVGMTREQFVQAMEVYESFPPLSEMERGFVNLEVISFSRERVVVQMNYKYVQPSESFYLAVYNNEIVVYLEDRRTVYIETEISLDSLPEQLQRDIIQMMWIENEEKLYNFLENYSS